VKIKLSDGKERSIQHMMATIFWYIDGKPMSAAGCWKASTRKASAAIRSVFIGFQRHLFS
jgi:hypothetical protein